MLLADWLYFCFRSPIAILATNLIVSLVINSVVLIVLDIAISLLE